MKNEMKKMILLSYCSKNYDSPFINTIYNLIISKRHKIHLARLRDTGKPKSKSFKVRQECGPKTIIALAK